MLSTYDKKPGETNVLQGGFRQSERLALELDFAKIAHQSEADTTHPHLLFSPVHYESGYAYPLLVWLHGHGDDERQIMRVMPTLSMRNYVAVAPRGQETLREESRRTGAFAENLDMTGPNLDVTAILRDRSRPKTVCDWPVSDSCSDACLEQSEQRIFGCISLAKKRCHIAGNRVFLAGFGSGGTMALRMALLYPEHFAGVASLGGPFPWQNRILSRWMPVRSLNVFLGTGRTNADFTPRQAGQALELLHTAGVSATAREYSCGQELTPEMLQDLNRWMMKIVCDE